MGYVPIMQRGGDLIPVKKLRQFFDDEDVYLELLATKKGYQIVSVRRKKK